MIIRHYQYGQIKEIYSGENGSACVEIILNDGRTARMSFSQDGSLNVRAWGNEPGKLGNWDRTTLRAIVQFEEQTHCPICLHNLARERCKCEKKEEERE